MPRISTTLPVPFSCLNSQSAPSCPYFTWSLESTYASGAETAWSTATTTMPLAAASLITGLSASRSDGLRTMALTPAEIRFRRSAICSAGPPLRLAIVTCVTTPDAFPWALMEQIISSRQPFPVKVLETPTLYVFAAPLVLLPQHAASRSTTPNVNNAAPIVLPARSTNSRRVQCLSAMLLPLLNELQ